MSTSDITTLDKVRAYLRLPDEQMKEDALVIWEKNVDAHSITGADLTISPSDTYSKTLTLNQDADSDGYTYSSDITLTSSAANTVEKLAGIINNHQRGTPEAYQWGALLVGSGDYRSSDLIAVNSEGCLGWDNRVTLQVEDNTTLRMLVEQATQMIENELGTCVVERSFREYLSGDGGQYLWLENYPVNTLEGAYIWRDDAIRVKYSSGDASYATASVTSNTVRLLSRKQGSTTTDVLAFSDYSVISDLTSAVEALSGWSAQSVSNYEAYPVDELLEVPPMDANDEWADLQVPEDPEDDCELEAEYGRLYNPMGWPTGERNIVVDYTAGYSTVPQQLESACLELVKLMWDLSKRSVGLKSEKIGDYQYTVADRLDAVFSQTGNTETSNLIAMKLTPYRRSMIGGI